mgnify:CR=1 FL=1
MSSFFTKGPDYFSMFEKGIGISNKAAATLQAAFADSEIDGDEIKKLKDIEHEGDRHVHQSAKLISESFITPIDRADMMNMVDAIEALTDSIDEVANQVYMMRITRKDKPTEKMIGLIVEACGRLITMISAFKQFKKDHGKIHEICIAVNHIEEEGDALYTRALRDLFDPENEVGAIEIIRRQHLYDSLENALDCCEDVADIMEQTIISNT